MGMVHTVLWQQVQGRRQWSLVPGLQRQVQEGHRQSRPGHPSTQATMHTPSTKRPVQNYLVPRLRGVDQVHPVWMQNYVVSWLRSVGPVPRSADSYGDYTKSCRVHFHQVSTVKLSKNIECFVCGPWL